MAKQWVKQQVRRNELQDVVDSGLKWTLQNKQTAMTALGALAATILAAGGLFYRNKSIQAAAWDKLAIAEGYAYTGRVDMSMQQLKELGNEYSGSKAGSLGSLLAGDILYRQGSYKEASEIYSKLMERGDPKIQPLALADLAMAQEASGQFAQATASAQRFLDAYSDHFMAPQVHACLGRSFQAAGQGDQAKQAFQKMVLQYPDTPWAAWAQTRLQAK